MFDLRYKAMFPFRKGVYTFLDFAFDLLYNNHPKGQIVFGLGTGRSGTNSLATLLNMQINARVWHEKEKWRIPWYGGESKINLQIHYFRVLSKQYDLVGDVAFYYLPYVPLIIEKIPNVKFVCMQRDKKETISSYIKWVARQNFCPWIPHNGKRWEYSHWDQCYPKYNITDIEKAVSLYYDEYYDIALKFENKFPGAFKIFNINALNTEKGQLDILNFLGVKKPLLKIGVKTNVNPDI